MIACSYYVLANCLAVHAKAFAYLALIPGLYMRSWIHCSFAWFQSLSLIHYEQACPMAYITDGSLSGGINREGVNYYNNLINELLSKGMRVNFYNNLQMAVWSAPFFISPYNYLGYNPCASAGMQPYGTLFHWDTPQALEDKYEGFLSPNIT